MYNLLVIIGACGTFLFGDVYTFSISTSDYHYTLMIESVFILVLILLIATETFIQSGICK